MQAAHQLRLQQLLESGRLTPVPSPSASPVPAAEAPAAPRKGRKRAHPKPHLEAVAEHEPNALPDAINYIVAVSTRSPDVGLENDHNLHQMAYDFILKHRLTLARHYLQDARLSEDELLAATQAAGMDEFYLGEHTSLEILQVPHYLSLASAPTPEQGQPLFADHFASRRVEEEAEAEAKRKEEQEAEAAAAAGAAGAKEGKEGDAASSGGAAAAPAAAAESAEKDADEADSGNSNGGGKKKAANTRAAKRRKA